MQTFIFGFILLISQKCICQENKIRDSTIGKPDTSINNPCEENKIFLRCEKFAEFTGGQKKWAKYLKSNLNVQVPVINKAPKGEYTVTIKFIVNCDGTIRDAVAENQIGFGMEEEAIRIISLSPNWIPASQFGRNVNSYRLQPVTFLVR